MAGGHLTRNATDQIRQGSMPHLESPHGALLEDLTSILNLMRRMTTLMKKNYAPIKNPPNHSHCRRITYWVENSPKRLFTKSGAKTYDCSKTTADESSSNGPNKDNKKK